MTATCFRCDWSGDTAAATCPECGAPLYRSVSPDRGRRAGPAPTAPMVREETEELGDPSGRPRSAPSNPRTILLIAGAVFSVIGLLWWGGAVDPGAERVDGSAPTSPETGGQLIYAVPSGDGTARLWRWDLVTDRVTRGPFIRSPLALVNVRSTADGRLGFTADAGNGIREAFVLDSLESSASPTAIGRGDIVEWTDRGTIVLLVERGRLLDDCRRLVTVAAIDVASGASERVVRDAVCGDVVSVGRTSLGYFFTIVGETGADLVGAGYRDAGALLRDHGMIDISPDGWMLVTPTSQFLADETSSDGSLDPPIHVSGVASRYRLFGGRPDELLVDAQPLRVVRVLAYSAGGERTLVIGRRGRDDAALWEVPLGSVGLDPQTPRFVVEVSGPTHAAYASDGTAFVLTGGRLWHLRNHRLTASAVPEGAPEVAGPFAWVLRPPTSDV